MKRLVCILAILMVPYCVAEVCFSKEERIVNPRNEFKGKTMEEVPGPDDQAYKEGIVRSVTHYDHFGRIRKIEHHYTEERARRDGIGSREQYYEPGTFKGPILRKASFFYTEAYSEAQGLSRIEVHYDPKGHKQREEIWYTDAFAARRNYARVEVLYARGNPVKRVFYDSRGAIVSSEEKKQVWKSD